MKKRVFLLLAGFFAAFATTQAQTYFGGKNIIIGKTNGAYSVYAVDIDGDGDKDVLSASDKMAWYENTDGNGNFGTQKVITAEADFAWSVYATDIDGDGDIDVLSASFNDNKIAWYENTDGNGNFGTQQVITTNAKYARSVYAIDIDGDGDIDVLSASEGDNKIAWYENTDGNGSFGSEQVITTDAQGASSVYAVDIDGDGDADVLSASCYDNKIAWYENTDGTGSFGGQQVITTNANYASSVYATDIDGDGDVDVLSASYFGNQIAWYENTDGNGSFGTQQVITTDVQNPRSVYASDIDGDGDADVLSASSWDDKIAWYENTDGKGSFGNQQVITTDADGASSVYAIDIDGDVDIDILSASFYDNKIALYKNTDGNGSFGTQQVMSAIADGASSVYFTDIDGDGDADVLSASEDDNKIALYKNTDGNGSFGIQQIITTDAQGASSVYAIDIDGDGDVDILSASKGDDKIAWYENTDANGNFGAQQIITTDAVGATSVYSIDIDGDGDVDVVSTSEGDEKIAWYENTDGNGSFGTQQIIANNAIDARSVYASDIDGDGDADVLSAFHDSLAWFENIDGMGSFSGKLVISIDVNFSNSVYAADIDGDGDTDVLSASYSKITWYENTDGNGSFGTQQVITTDVNFAVSVYATDIDGDGDIDVMSASSYDNKIAWYENTDGNGSFGSQQVITDRAIDARSVFAVDIDGDGNANVLSASAWDGTIAWYGNFKLEIITHPQNQNVCPNSSSAFFLEVKYADIYQWQVNEGSGFIDLSENAVYTGTATDNLIINNATLDMNDYIYRCTLSNPGGSTNTNEAVLTVADSISPEITCVENKTIDLIEGQTSYTVDGTGFDPITDDNCEVASIINDHNNTESLEGEVFTAGIHTISWIVTDANSNFSECAFVLTVNKYTGIEKLQQMGISIFPNPTNGKIIFDFANNNIQKLTISDIIGKQIIEKLNCKQNVTIDLSTFANGIYIAIIQLDNELIKTRIIKE